MNEIEKKESETAEDINLGRFFELATGDKICVNKLNLHEIGNETSKEKTDEFEMIGSVLISEIEQKTKIRLNKIDDYENFIDAIDVE